MIEAAKRPLPAGVAALGYAGLVPFVAGALAIVTLDGEARQFAVRALVAYGAVILSFLGAVHWGLLLRQADAATPARLAIGVLPPGYLDLRRQLSLAVCALLTLALLAVGS